MKQDAKSVMCEISIFCFPIALASVIESIVLPIIARGDSGSGWIEGESI